MRRGARTRAGLLANALSPRDFREKGPVRRTGRLPAGLPRNRHLAGFRAALRGLGHAGGADRARISGVKHSIRFPLVALAGLLAGAFFAAPAARAADAMIYRIELASGPALFARTPPVPQGSRLVFARYPDGAVVSMRRSEVKRVVSVPVVRDAAASKAGAAKTVHNLRPGELLVLGPTGDGRSGAEASGGSASAMQPGEAPGGKALLNPTRDYRPEWDARQVPGANIAHPASPSDYREGATFAYPPASGTQSGSGQPPTGVPTGQPPKP
jgi:hypothetical protein